MTDAPSNKAVASAVAGSAVSILLWVLLEWKGIDPPAHVASSGVTLLTFAVFYFTGTGARVPQSAKDELIAQGWSYPTDPAVGTPPSYDDFRP